MELLFRPTRCPRLRPRRWLLLAGLAALCVASFLASGAHEELLSRSLPLFLAGADRTAAAAAAPPPPDAFVLAPPPDTCRPRAPFLLVLVTSAPGHAAQRQAVRETWGGPRRAAGRAVRTLFALGLPAEPALQAALTEEAARHGDIVQGRFADTYANLTLKTLALLGWARAHCGGARFLAKADDDVFLNLPALARHLAHLADPRGVYLGRIHWRVSPDRDPRSRHHVPAALYAPAAFPPYCSGTAYVLSGDAAAAVLGAARHVPLVPLEDAFVGLCARRAGIAPRHVAAVAGAARFPPDPCCYREVLFSVHGVAPATMRDVWLRAPEPPCSALQRALGRLRCKALAWWAAL